MAGRARARGPGVLIREVATPCRNQQAIEIEDRRLRARGLGREDDDCLHFERPVLNPREEGFVYRIDSAFGAFAIAVGGNVAPELGTLDSEGASARASAV